MGKWENEQINKHGYCIHYVPRGEEQVDFHTHGVSNTYQHPDFQIVLPLQKEVAATIFQDLIAAIKDGATFDREGVYDSILDNCPVYLAKTMEGGRNIMRLIFPDARGNFRRGEEKQDMFANQWNALD